jgi:D-glycero-D-manno-heptose 1,7-bisphosphate phosphatase
MKIKIAGFDLDGTLRETKSGERFINNPEDQQPIAGAVRAVNYCKNLGYRCIGITNQGGVATGHKSIGSAAREQQITLELFPELDYIYFCPDLGNECWLVCRNNPPSEIHKSWAHQYIGKFRKPNAGMIEAAILNYGGRHLHDYSGSFFTGDREEDLQAAALSNLPFYYAVDFRENYVRLLNR